MPPPRNVTPEELLRAAGRMHRRVTRQLDQLDSGDADAFDELASSNRTTLCFGKGDRLLLRLVNVFRQVMPDIAVMPLDMPRDSPTVLGPLPDYPGSDVPGISVMPISKWVETQALRLPGAGARTWNQLLAELGNTYGAHVSATVPELLDEIRVFGVAGGTMTSQMLRSAGVVAEYGLGQVLAAIHGEQPPPIRDLHAAEVRVGYMGMIDADEARFAISCTAQRQVQLFSMPVFDGRRLTGRWDWDASTQAGSIHLDWS